ncbi:RxLR effector protein [Phytophthora megakarya]|uniref:RxLR effector protein n=1 Tax=Phytophthora megakarya TaxID=4795 RepID=A0A225VPA6_9STRA|nr:RxLR effector protein [Phytophthora megakarya]
MKSHAITSINPPNSRYVRVEQSKVDYEQRNSVGLIDKLASLIKSLISKIKAQIKIISWKRSKKSTDEAFALLKLDQTGENLFTNPKFKIWLRYVDKTVEVQPKQAIVAILTAKYGDDGLARMLQAAKNGRESKLATMLQTEQMWSWLTGTKGKSTDDVFKLLKLDKGVDKVLTNPNLKAWEDYVQFYTIKFNVKKPTTTIDSLTAFYGDDAVAKMLEAARKKPGTKRRAKKLQTAQFTKWLSKDIKPAQVWKMLKMDKQTWTTNPDADVWRRYLAFYKLNKPAT